MRLLHTTNFQLKTFITDVPAYAILSHTWGDEEVTFDLIFNHVERVKLRGWSKVFRCCQRASADGWEWIWIDTCCINKADTTELGEAINSMFHYYEAAEICYAYLVDVPPQYRLSDLAYENRPDQNIPADIAQPLDHNGIPWEWTFRASRWFTRGWTLQELLAPRFLIFLDFDWGDIGSRERMADEIERATGIEVKYLWDFRATSVATKMSWAANRRTTRVEDMAYCLMGLFDVNMALIYGEGKRAFLRLQRELIQNLNDESILAWGGDPQSGHIFHGLRLSSALAQSLDDFHSSTSIVPWLFDNERRTFSTTNIGISLNAEVFEHVSRNIDGTETIYAIKLNCRQEWPPSGPPLVLLLTADDPHVTVFQRVNFYRRNWNEVETVDWKSLGRRDIFIRHDRRPDASQALTESVAIHIQSPQNVEILSSWSFPLEQARPNVTLCGENRAEPTPKQSDTNSNNGTSPRPPSSPSNFFQRLQPKEGICHGLVLTADGNREHFWLVLRPGPRQPHAGIWRASPPDDDSGAGSSRRPFITIPAIARAFVHAHAAHAPPHLFPCAAPLASEHATLDLALMPRQNIIGSCSRAYTLKITFAPKKSYRGVLGAFVRFGEKGRFDGVTEEERYRPSDDRSRRTTRLDDEDIDIDIRPRSPSRQENIHFLHLPRDDQFRNRRRRQGSRGEEFRTPPRSRSRRAEFTSERDS